MTRSLRLRKDIPSTLRDAEGMTSAEVLDLTVADVLVRFPGAARVLATHGMSCVGCPFAPFETVSEVAHTYRLNATELATALLNGPLGNDQPEGRIP